MEDRHPDRRALENLVRESAAAEGVTLSDVLVNNMVKTLSEFLSEPDETVYMPGLHPDKNNDEYSIEGDCNLITGHVNIWPRQILTNQGRRYGYPKAKGLEDYIETASIRRLNEVHFHEMMHKYGKVDHEHTEKGQETFDRIVSGEHNWLFGAQWDVFLNENGSIRARVKPACHQTPNYTVWHIMY